MTRWQPASLFAAWVLTIKPAGALVLALGDLRILLGHSADGLPYIVPALACAALLWIGWKTRSSWSSLWQLISWLSLLGASMFARTPLGLLIGPGAMRDVAVYPWERWPLFAVAVILVIRAGFAFRSRWGIFRLLASCIVGLTIFAIFVPYVPQVVERYPLLVIFFGFGTVGAFVVTSAFVHSRTGDPHELSGTV